MSIATSTPVSLRHPACTSVEVEPPGCALISRKQPRSCARRDHPLHVDRVGLALADQAAGRVGEDVEVRVVHRAQHALGLLRGRQLELAVDRRDDEVELAEDVVRQVELAVLQDVDLDALQHRDARQLAR